jgi:hypothetical protein
VQSISWYSDADRRNPHYGGGTDSGFDRAAGFVVRAFGFQRHAGFVDGEFHASACAGSAGAESIGRGSKGGKRRRHTRRRFRTQVKRTVRGKSRGEHSIQIRFERRKNRERQVWRDTEFTEFECRLRRSG